MHVHSPGTPKNPAAALGNLHQSAAADARANRSADFAQRLRSESESLVSWAVENGFLISPSDLIRTLSGLTELAGGNEHQVWRMRREGPIRVLKQTRPPGFGARGAAEAYLENLLRCNLLFADDVRLEGIVVAPEGPVILTSQPFIEGRCATEQEITDYFTRLNYVPCRLHHWRHQQYPVQIADARPANILVDELDECFPIDVHILGTLPAEWLEETAPPEA